MKDEEKSYIGEPPCAAACSLYRTFFDFFIILKAQPHGYALLSPSPPPPPRPPPFSWSSLVQCSSPQTISLCLSFPLSPSTSNLPLYQSTLVLVQWAGSRRAFSLKKKRTRERQHKRNDCPSHHPRDRGAYICVYTSVCRERDNRRRRRRTEEGSRPCRRRGIERLRLLPELRFFLFRGGRRRDGERSGTKKGGRATAGQRRVTDIAADSRVSSVSTRNPLPRSEHRRLPPASASMLKGSPSLPPLPSFLLGAMNLRESRRAGNPERNFPSFACSSLLLFALLLPSFSSRDSSSVLHLLLLLLVLPLPALAKRTKT